MNKYLTLEDGTVFSGIAFGDVNGLAAGEVVFNTGMTGYQEAATDPSYSNQLLTFTYPLIGTYGINTHQNQSLNISCQAFIIRHLENEIGSTGLSVDTWLNQATVPGISDLDTRQLAKHIRQHGTLRGIITNTPVLASAFEETYNQIGQIKKRLPSLRNDVYKAEHSKFKVVLLDCGTKQAIIDELLIAGCSVRVLPYTATLASITALHPDGVIVSNGPGNPADYAEVLPLLSELEQLYPTAGICLGHQLLALANGAQTYQLPFGHRGVNHPVTSSITGKTIITSQNHGFAVTKQSLEATDLKVTEVESNDGTIEALSHTKLPMISVQYHPEAHPGPHDGEDFFEQFKKLMQVKVKIHA